MTGKKRIGTERGKDRNLRLTPEPVFLIAGIWGILLTVRSIEQISFSAAAVFACTLLAVTGLYILLFFQKKRMLGACAAALAAVCAYLAVRNRTRFLSQFQAIADALMSGEQQAGENVTFAVLITAVALSVIFFVLEMIWRRHWILYLLMTVLMAGIPVIGGPVRMAPAVLWLVFQIMFWAIQVSDGRRLRKSSENGQQKLTGRVCICLCGLLAVLIVISSVITSLWGGVLSGIVYRGEGIVSRSLQQMSGGEQDPVADGYVSRGNNYRTGRIRFQVTLSRQPEEALYLKGFTGGAYADGEWAPADDSEVIHQTAQILGWEDWETWVGDTYSYLYFVINGARGAEAPERRSLSLEYASDGNRTAYLPYYNGRFQENTSGNDGYTLEYYQRNEIQIDWEALPEELETGTGWYRAVQEAYMQVIPEAYTQIPEAQLPRLAQLCREHPVNSLNEATAYILAVLQSQASYTLTPGRIPLNEDVVEYFLFDSHEGYCVHFASVAALMYRMLGFPSRYASGYVLQPADFVQQEDGSWTAEVTDEYAHAWPEIFLEDYGWVPVEVTPASDGSYQTSYPGLDTETLEGMIDAQYPETDPAGTDLPEAGQSENTEINYREGGSASLMNRTGRIVFMLIPAAGAILFLLFFRLRRERLRRKTEDMNCREIFGSLLRLLGRAGLMRGYTGTEKDFVPKLMEALPFLDQRETERLVEIVNLAAYGKDQPGQEDCEFVRRVYFRTEDWIRERCNRK